MYFLDELTQFNICTNSTLNPLWGVVGIIVKAIWIGIPILLIIFGSIDLGKAVIASKEDEIKKATKAFGKRFLYAVAVFAVVWVVTLILNLVSGFGLTNGQGGTIGEDELQGWRACWCKINKGTDHEINEKGNCVKKSE